METHGLQVTVHFSVSPNTSLWVNFTQTLTPKYHVNWRFLILRTKRGGKWPKGRRGSVLGVAVTQNPIARTHTLARTFVLWPLADITVQYSPRSQGYVSCQYKHTGIGRNGELCFQLIAGASGYCHQRSLGLSVHTLCFCACVFTIPEPSLHFLRVLTTGWNQTIPS